LKSGYVVIANGLETSSSKLDGKIVSYCETKTKMYFGG
jgi:hypothetical protein